MTAAFKYTHPRKWTFIWRGQCQLWQTLFCVNDSFNAQKGGRHQCWLTMPERKWLNRTGNQTDHKISTPPQGKKKSPKNRWHQASKMGEKEPPHPPTAGFQHLSWKCISVTICISYGKFMPVFIFWWETNIFFSFYPNVYWFATTLQARTTSQAWKLTKKIKSYDHKANNKKMAPVYFINIWCTN